MDAVYRMGGFGDGVPVRLILARPDEEISLGRASQRTSSAVAKVRTAEVPSVRAGDTFAVGDELFTVKGAPDRGPRRLEWVMDFR